MRQLNTLEQKQIDAFKKRMEEVVIPQIMVNVRKRVRSAQKERSKLLFSNH